MINYLQNKMHNSYKILALLLILFCGQLSLSAHTHNDIGTGLEACSVCLVGQNAEFDDVVLPTNNAEHLTTSYPVDSENIASQFISDNTLLIVRLRGPPA